MYNFSQQWLCLSGEASIASSTLKTGLDTLKIACTKHYNYPLAFFNLSIGLERLFKLILICESIIEQTTDKLELKKDFGHDLLKLQSRVDAILKKYNLLTNPTIISQNMLIELTKFAENERYFNLNYLLKSSETTCPVKSWSQNVGDEIIKSHCLEIANVPHRIPKFVIFGYNEQNTELKTKEEFSQNYILQLLKYKYTSYYMHQTIKNYTNYFHSISLNVHEKQLDIPYLYEFFEYFDVDSENFINSYNL